MNKTMQCLPELSEAGGQTVDNKMWGWEFSPVVEHLPNNFKVLGSVLSWGRGMMRCDKGTWCMNYLGVDSDGGEEKGHRPGNTGGDF